MASRNFVLLACAALTAGCYRSDGPGSSGSGGGSTATSPTVTGLARYYDVDRSGDVNDGDRLVVPFSSDVSAGTTDATALELVVLGDDLGSGATLIDGPASHELTVVLGAGGSLKSRQAFSADRTDPNSASGVDVAQAIPAGAIVDAQTGATAEAGLAIDIVPGFVPGTDLATGPTTAVARGDLNGDGIPDLVIGGASAGFGVLLGDGAGGFQSAGGVKTGTAIAIAIADLDKDGDADVVLGTTAQDEIWYGDGEGGFVQGSALQIDEPTQGLDIADMDCDGDLDIVTAGQDAIRFYRNDGDGFFSNEPASYGIGSMDVVLADFDRDGDMDVLSADADGTRIWRNEFTGFLTGLPPIETEVSRALAVADIDQDGRLDFVAGRFGQDRIWRGNGLGQFDSAGALQAANTRDVIFADVDQDSLPDLLVGSDEGLGIWSNRGGASFLLSEQLDTGRVDSMAVGDWNRDGDDDLVAVGGSSSLRIFEGSLAGSWGTSTLLAGAETIGTGESLSAAHADIDLDGDPDLVLGRDGFVDFHNNQRDEAFDEEPQTRQIQAGDVTDVDFADVDFDGAPDLLLTRREGLALLLNDGEGNFMDEEPPTSEEALSAFSLALDYGDVDNNGGVDVIVGNLEGPDLLYMNPGCDDDGWEGFPDPARLPTNVQIFPRTETTDVALADVDGDGDLDMVLTQAHDGPALIYRNDGTGALEDFGESLDTGGARSLAVADLDRDGDPDLAIGTESQGLRIWTNDGSGNFSAGPVLSAGYVRRVRFEDLNGDRFPELIAVRIAEGGFMPALQVWRNVDGEFIEAATMIETPEARAFTTGDLDLDGDADVLIGFEPLDLGSVPFWNR